MDDLNMRYALNNAIGRKPQDLKGLNHLRFGGHCYSGAAKIGGLHAQTMLLDAGKVKRASLNLQHRQDPECVGFRLDLATGVVGRNSYHDNL